MSVELCSVKHSSAVSSAAPFYPPQKVPQQLEGLRSIPKVADSLQLFPVKNPLDPLHPKCDFFLSASFLTAAAVNLPLTLLDVNLAISQWRSD